MVKTEPTKIDINSAGVRELTQLPGIAKNIAYRIVNHRHKHGLFTAWEELLEVKEFPVGKLELIRARASLICKDEGWGPPRHVSTSHLDRVRKKPTGFNKALRATQSPAKMHGPTTHRPH
jgi:competence ComEA-like helix-hairpin-helix protein